ncbi:MAG: NAD(P)-dependent oxidoreductase, partial [Steroidobacteraceae bacterium]
VTDLVVGGVAGGARPGAAGRVYNVGDGDHASTTTYLRLVARLAGLPEPPEVERAEAETVLPPMAWSFLTDSRRVNTRRMREELGVAPKCARLEDGIRQALPPAPLQGP